MAALHVHLVLQQVRPSAIMRYVIFWYLGTLVGEYSGTKACRVCRLVLFYIYKKSVYLPYGTELVHLFVVVVVAVVVFQKGRLLKLHVFNWTFKVV